MKRLVIALLLINSKSFSQPVVGLGGGFSFEATVPLMNLQAGARFGDSHVCYNQIIHLTRKADVNQIIGIRYGYNIKTFQPFAGYDYHLNSNAINEEANPRIVVKNKNKRGFHPSYGLTKYFKELPLMISICKSYKYVSFTFGLYKMLK